MKLKSILKPLCLLLLLLNTAAFIAAQSQPIKQRNVRAHMEFLASDAMQGRGSGTQFEWIAGQYMAAQMRQFGIEPAGDSSESGSKSYIQTITISRNSFVDVPKFTYSSNGSAVNLEHGKEMLVLRLSTDKIAGKFQKISVNEKPKKGSVAFVTGDNVLQKIGGLLGSGAKAIIIEETPRFRRNWERTAKRKISFSSISGKSDSASTAIILVSKDSAKALAKVADGTEIQISGTLGKAQIKHTWNAIGMIKGTDAKLSSEVILLSAHMDHLGVRKNARGKDKIFNGADDDASGSVAVLELARVLAKGEKPKRSVYFVFFGSEEAGGFGATYFVKNLPFPKEKLIANLEFEMLGRPDKKVAKDELWLTGYKRSNLGSELAKRGAKLVNDPHPEQNFFRRSDNYTLATQGIIAHTVSSYGLHKDYHRASDEIKTIDFEHMTRSINSMVKPINWLINSTFKPKWHKGKKP